MKRGVIFGLLGAAAVSAACFAVALAPSRARAEQPTKTPKVEWSKNYTDEEGCLYLVSPRLERVEHADGRIEVQLTTFIQPVFEGGALGQPCPVKVKIEIKTSELGSAPTTFKLNDQLPEQVKAALESALKNYGQDKPTLAGDDKLDKILDRLERIEKRLQEVERSQPRRAKPLMR